MSKILGIDLGTTNSVVCYVQDNKPIVFVTHNVSESVVLGNKVVIFSHRPSVVKKEITIDYRRPRLVEDENLVKYQKEILNELRPEVKANLSSEKDE